MYIVYSNVSIYTHKVVISVCLSVPSIDHGNVHMLVEVIGFNL